MNSLDEHKQFTYEKENNNNKHFFLKILVFRESNACHTTVIHLKLFEVSLHPHALPSHPPNQAY